MARKKPIKWIHLEFSLEKRRVYNPNNHNPIESYSQRQRQNVDEQSGKEVKPKKKEQQKKSPNQAPDQRQELGLNGKEQSNKTTKQKKKAKKQNTEQSSAQGQDTKQHVDVQSNNSVKRKETKLQKQNFGHSSVQGKEKNQTVGRQNVNKQGTKSKKKKRQKSKEQEIGQIRIPLQTILHKAKPIDVKTMQAKNQFENELITGPVCQTQMQYPLPRTADALKQAQAPAQQTQPFGWAQRSGVTRPDGYGQPIRIGQPVGRGQFFRLEKSVGRGQLDGNEQYYRQSGEVFGSPQPDGRGQHIWRGKSFGQPDGHGQPFGPIQHGGRLQSIGHGQPIVQPGGSRQGEPTGHRHTSGNGQGNKSGDKSRAKSGGLHTETSNSEQRKAKSGWDKAKAKPKRSHLSKNRKKQGQHHLQLPNANKIWGRHKISQQPFLHHGEKPLFTHKTCRKYNPKRGTFHIISRHSTVKTPYFYTKWDGRMRYQQKVMGKIKDKEKSEHAHLAKFKCEKTTAHKLPSNRCQLNKMTDVAGKLPVVKSHGIEKGRGVGIPTCGMSSYVWTMKRVISEKDFSRPSHLKPLFLTLHW